MVGFSALAPCLMLCLALLLSFMCCFHFGSWFEHYSRVFAAFETGDDRVWFSTLLHADTTVHVWIDKAFTIPTNQASVFSWQSYSCFHGDSSGNLSVTLRSRRFLSDVALGQPE
jgi:hypothetical protein